MTEQIKQSNVPQTVLSAVADPGFPVWVGGGGWTSDTGTFRWKHMQKRKNWVPLGGGAPWIRQWSGLLRKNRIGKQSTK